MGASVMTAVSVLSISGSSTEVGTVAENGAASGCARLLERAAVRAAMARIARIGVVSFLLMDLCPRLVVVVRCCASAPSSPALCRSGRFINFGC